MSVNQEDCLNQEFFIGEYIDETGNYVKVKFRKIERWAFYLRFIGQWYNPCPKCQQKLKDLFLNAALTLSTQTARVDFRQNVTKDNRIIYTFALPFIQALPYYEFEPCANCQKQIRKAVVDSTTLTIGNKDYAHPIELNRKNEDDDDSFFTVDTHKATDTEQEQFGDGWTKHRITKEEYHKLSIIKE